MRKRNFGLVFFETSTLDQCQVELELQTLRGPSYFSHPTVLREAPAVSRCSRSLVAKLLVAAPFFFCTIVYRDVCMSTD